KKAKGCVDANTRKDAGRVVRLWGEMIAPTLLWSVFASGFALAEPQIARFPLFAAGVVQPLKALRS
ncbi:MAG: hypothetical protein WCE69_07890, partial [Aestuariivirga sp.]